MKNIIFDFGQVLIDIAPERVDVLFRQALGHRYESAFRALIEQDVFNRLEVDALSEESFIWAIQHASGGELGGREILRIWNAMLVGIPAHRLKFLAKLREQYRVFLLSNTNSIHLKAIYRYLEQEHQIYDFDTRFFDRAWYSHEIKLRKPDPAIYQYILNAAKIKPEETLFIDDNPDNVVEARRAGIVGIVHDPSDDIVAVFDTYLEKLV